MTIPAWGGGGQKFGLLSGEGLQPAAWGGGGQKFDSSSGEDTKSEGGGGVPELVDQINKIQMLQLEIKGLRRQKWYGEDVTAKLAGKKLELDQTFQNITNSA